MSPRPYRVGKRQVEVEEARERVIEAARTLFAESGFFGASLEDVAKRAGVARATVYYQFESKFGLLDATIASTLARASSDALRRTREHADAAKAVAMYPRAVAEFWASEYAFFHNIIGFAAVNPELAKVEEPYNARRKELISWLVKRLEDQGKLRGGVSPKQAVDTLWLLTSFQSYEQLHLRSGLSPRAVGATLSDIAVAALLAPN